MQCLVSSEVLSSLINHEINDLLSSYLLDHLPKPIDLSMTTTDQTSSMLSGQQLTTSESILPIKNMIESTVENARRREKQLEHEISRKERKKERKNSF